jgi:hypothetical protein
MGETIGCNIIVSVTAGEAAFPAVNIGRRRFGHLLLAEDYAGAGCARSGLRAKDRPNLFQCPSTRDANARFAQAALAEGGEHWGVEGREGDDEGDDADLGEIPLGAASPKECPNILLRGEVAADP